MPKKINCKFSDYYGNCLHPNMKGKFLFITFNKVCSEIVNQNLSCSLKEENPKPKAPPSPPPQRPQRKKCSCNCGS